MQLWGAAVNGRTSTKDRICRYRCRMFPCAIHTTNSHSQSIACWRFLSRDSHLHLPNSSFLCIIKGCPASEGGSRLCRRRCSVWLHSNRKTERSDCVVGRECWAVPGKGMPQQHPPRSVEAAESALGLLPSMALSSAQIRLIITAAGAGRALPGGSWSMALYLGGKIHVDHESSPPKEATRHE